MTRDGGYWKAAAAVRVVETASPPSWWTANAGVKGMAYEPRQEVKLPRVPRSAIVGFFVGSEQEREALAGLGVPREMITKRSGFELRDAQRRRRAAA